MRNSFFLLCVVLLLEGVSGDVDVVVSALTGDSVTLKPDNIVTLKKNDWIQWKFNDILISKMKKTDEDFINDFTPDEKFSGRLDPDTTTGSLTITNIGTEHAGRYKVEINTVTEKSKTYSVTVHDTVKSVSVLEGDSVTLHSGVTKKQGDQIHWKFGDETLTSDVDYTITNIQRSQAGDYEVEINTSSMILHRKFPVNCSGKKRRVSVMEGHFVNLYTGLIKIQGYDQIKWEFGDQIIAEINQEKNHLSFPNGDDEGRLQLSENSGSLNITRTKSTDSGVYHLKMNSRSHTLQRNITVTVSESDSSGAVSGIYSASFGLVIWAVAVSLLQV